VIIITELAKVSRIIMTYLKIKKWSENQVTREERNNLPSIDVCQSRI
jgi:hypothetical protein